MAAEIGQNCLDLIRHCEGTVLHVYLDAAGLKTAGTGHLLRAADGSYAVGDQITQAQADAWLQQDLAAAASCVDSHCPDLPTDNARSALIDFAYNAGCNNLARLVADGNGTPDGIAQQFPYWTRAGQVHPRGLRIRRMLERDLFLAPDGPMPEGWLVKYDTHG